jgi:F-type H+-transporting ATPase subunit b
MIVLAEFNVIRPDWGLIFWTIIIFGIFWFVIGRYAFKPIANALLKRERDIQNALDEAKKARDEMSNLKSENEKLLQQAKEERAQILKDAKNTKNEIIKEAKEKAKEEANRIVVSAKREIENEKQQALLDVKNQVGAIALDIAEKVIRKELAGDKDQRNFVDTLVDDLELN